MVFGTPRASQASPSPARAAPAARSRCMLARKPGSARSAPRAARSPLSSGRHSGQGRGLPTHACLSCRIRAAALTAGALHSRLLTFPVAEEGRIAGAHIRRWLRSPRNADDYFELVPGPLSRSPALVTLTSSSEQFLHSWYVQLRENCLFSTL